MDDKRTAKKILEWKPIGTRIRGRPRKRWIVDIEEDMQIIGIKGLRKQCKERAEWKRITEKAKTHRGVVMPVKEEEDLNYISAVCIFVSLDDLRHYFIKLVDLPRGAWHIFIFLVRIVYPKGATYASGYDGMGDGALRHGGGPCEIYSME